MLEIPCSAQHGGPDDPAGRDRTSGPEPTPVAEDPGGRLRVRLAADYERLEFLRVLRDHGARQVSAPSALILPETPPGTATAPATDQPDG